MTAEFGSYHDLSIRDGHRFSPAECKTTIEQRRAAGKKAIRELGRDCRDVLDALGITWENTR